MENDKPWYERVQCHPLATVCAWYGLNGGGKPTHLSTVLRHVQQGAVGLDGKRVTLAAVRCGNRWMTSRERFAAFMRALTPADNLAGSTDGAAHAAGPATRRRKAEEADAGLQRLGCS